MPSCISTSGEGNGTPLQYSCLENPVDGGAWQAAVHGVGGSRTWLNDFTFTFHFHALEKEMAIHSIILAWRISGTGEPGGLPSMESHRVGHDWSNLAAATAYLNLSLSKIPIPKLQVLMNIFFLNQIVFYFSFFYFGIVDLLCYKISGVQHSDSEFLKFILHLFLL